MSGKVRDFGLVLAIDAKDREQVLGLVDRLGRYVDGVKLGVPTLLANGVSVAKDVRAVYEGPIIADLKVADIGFRSGAGSAWSGTNKAIVETAVSAGIDYVICQAIVGTSSLQESADAAHSGGGMALTLPYMTHEGAGLFFDMPVEQVHASAWLSELGFASVVDEIQELRARKSREVGWRMSGVTVSDLVLLLGEAVGVDGYIAPANKPEVMADYRRLTQRKVMATGVGRQGGALADVYRTLGANSAAIAGHAIYAEPDPVAACRKMLEERARVTGGG